MLGRVLGVHWTGDHGRRVALALVAPSGRESPADNGHSLPSTAENDEQLSTEELLEGYAGVAEGAIARLAQRADVASDLYTIYMIAMLVLGVPLTLHRGGLHVRCVGLLNQVRLKPSPPLRAAKIA
jgi:hypothetical protein